MLSRKPSSGRTGAVWWYRARMLIQYEIPETKYISNCKKCSHTFELDYRGAA